MIVRWFLIALSISGTNSECIKNKIKLWSPTKCEAGKTFFAKLSTIPDFLVRGIIQPYLYPWLAEIHIEPPTHLRVCSGALINDRYVLTAQSCIFPPVQPFQVRISVGFYNGYDNDLSERFQPRILERSAEKLILHPSYDPTDPQTSGNNLGLIKLDKPVKYSKTIYPIQLPAPGDKFVDYGNQLAENVEWSFFGNNKELKENPVRILNYQQCGDFNNNYRQIIESDVVCSVDVGNGTKPCGEENGGLLTVARIQRTYNITVLVGITAWGPMACDDFGSPKVYVRIDYKLAWIKVNTRDGLYCRY